MKWLARLFGRGEVHHLFGGVDPKSGHYFPCRAAKAAWEKDPEYYDAMPGDMPVKNFVGYWKAKYPEDFPLGGSTNINDVTAIKPKQERL